MSTPASRLAKALAPIGAAGVADLCDALGIERRIGNRALRGRQVNASVFVQLCCAWGVDPYTGSPYVGIDARTGAPYSKISYRGPILWWFLGAAVNLQRIGDELSQRDAAKQAGVHYTTICRVEDAQPVSADNYLAICKWLGAPIERFTANSNCNKREAA